MSQKETIVNMLKTNGTMTQGALAEAIYGDKFRSITQDIISNYDEKLVVAQNEVAS